MNLTPFSMSVIVVLASQFLFSVSFGQSSSAATLTRIQQAQLYDEAVHILGGNANVISRWVGDIQYHLIGSEKFKQQTVDTLNDVAELSGLQLVAISNAPSSAEKYIEMLRSTPAVNLSSCGLDSDCANFVVVQSSNKIMEEMAEAIPLRKVYQRSLTSAQPVSCFFAPFVSSGQIIRQVFIYISDALSDAMISTCLHEEIYQSLGLFNDFSDAEYFSFNNKVEPKSITEYDRRLLETIYSSEFAPGTPVFRVLKRFMEDMGLDPFGD